MENDIGTGVLFSDTVHNALVEFCYQVIITQSAYLLPTVSENCHHNHCDPNC